MNRNSQKKVQLNKFISHFFRVKSHHTFEVINITLFGAPKACTSINSLYNTSCFLFFLRQKPLKIKAHQLMWELFGATGGWCAFSAAVAVIPWAYFSGERRNTGSFLSFALDFCL